MVNERDFSRAKSLTAEKLINPGKSFSPAAYYFLMRLLSEEKQAEYVKTIESKLKEFKIIYGNSYPDIVTKAEDVLKKAGQEYDLELYNRCLKLVVGVEKPEDKVKLFKGFISLNPVNPHCSEAQNLIGTYEVEIAENRRKAYQSLLEGFKSLAVKDYEGYLAAQRQITQAKKEYSESEAELSGVMEIIEKDYFKVLGIEALPPLAGQVDDERDKQTNLPLQVICIANGAVMVLVPGGEFTRGAELVENERPARRIDLTAYYIDKYEVSNARFKKFVEATNHKTDAETVTKGYVFRSDSYIVENACWKDPQGNSQGIDERQDHPVVQVSWSDANKYAEWAGQQLPTEAQWEKAARTTKGQKYPWGDEWDATKCNSSENGPDRTDAVNIYEPGASFYGCLNMAGNVSEWCRDWYQKDYYRISPQGNPPGPAEGLNHTLRGGSWETPQDFLRCSKRTEGLPIEDLGGCWTDALGFRCVIEIK
ncbi:MAG: formylglycine-generating enzyme family protein [Planctomycetota bacterium]